MELQSIPDVIRLYNTLDRMEASVSILQEELEQLRNDIDRLQNEVSDLEVDLLKVDVADLGKIRVKTAMSDSRKQFVAEFLRVEKNRLYEPEVAFLRYTLDQTELDEEEMDMIKKIFARLDKLSKK